MPNQRQPERSVQPYKVTYSAILHPDGKRFVVYATGLNRTPYYKTIFQVDPSLVAPPEVDLVNIPPHGVVPQHLQPFHVELSLFVENIGGLPQKVVIVHDPAGAHVVPIEQAALSGSNGGGEIPTPF